MVFLISNPLTEPLKQFLVWINGVVAATIPLPDSVSSWAIAIMAVAILVKLGTQPLTSRQQASMRKMQELQPKINALQKKHKDDRETLSAKQMELYKEAGVNPLGGCLPLLVQMVVLFAMWRAIMGLASTGELVGRFLWVPDLAVCEPSPLCGQELALLPLAIPLLLITMVVAQIVYQRLMTPPSRANDPQQQAMASMMKFMPLIFAYIFIKFPAALVLYYATFNVVGLAQQSWLNRRAAALEASASVVEAPNPGDDGTEAPAEDESGEDQVDSAESKENEGPNERTTRRKRRRGKKNR